MSTFGAIHSSQMQHVTRIIRHARCAGWRDGKPRALEVDKANFLAQKQVMRVVVRMRLGSCFYKRMFMSASLSRGRACKQGTTRTHTGGVGAATTAAQGLETASSQ